MKLSYKLILGYLLVASLAGIITLFALHSYQKIEGAFESLMREPVPIIRALEDHKTSGFHIISSTNEICFILSQTDNPDDSTLIEEEQQFNDSGLARYRESLERYEKLTDKDNANDLKFLALIKKNGDALILTSEQMIAMKKKRVAGTLLLEKKEEFEAEERAYLQAIDNALADEYAELEDAQKDIHATIAEATSNTLFAAFLTFILAIIFGLYISRYISTRINKFTEASEEVGRGQLNRIIEIKTNDEIGDLGRAFNKMIGDLKISRSDLAISQNFTDKVLDSMFDFVVVVNMDLTISKVNHAALKINGYEEQELIGQSINMLIGDRPFNQKGIDSVRQTGFIPNLDKLNLNKDGTLTPISMSLSVLKDEQGAELGIVCVGKDISERKRVEAEQARLTAQLESQRRQLNDIIANIQGVVWETTINKTGEAPNQFDFVSDYIFTMLGYKVEEFLSTPNFWLDVIHPEDKRRVLREVLDIFKNRQNGTIEYRWVRKDGRVIWIESRNEVVYNAAGEKIGLRGVTMDITERRQAEEKLKVFNEKLQQSNRELQDFAYVASHDLQEPLRKVQAFSDRLSSKYADALTGSGLDYLERMRNAASRMQTLIQDLLTFSRVSTKAQPFLPVNLDTVAREVLSDLEISIEQSGAKVELENLPEIDADPTQMRQLIQNLVGNALKFRRADTASVIKISARAVKSQSNGSGSSGTSYELMVEDNGIGFDEKYLDRIFTVFQRLHGRTEYQGSGVGLAVCRKIAERHHGSITAHSCPDQGTTFIVTLPLRQPNTEEN